MRLWQRVVNVHSQNMADFSAEFIRLKKRKCLVALLVSEVLDESNDSKDVEEKLERGSDEEARRDTSTT